MGGMTAGRGGLGRRDGGTIILTKRAPATADAIRSKDKGIRITQYKRYEYSYFATMYLFASHVITFQ